MKVACISYSDAAGYPTAVARALAEHEEDVEAISVQEIEGGFSFGADITMRHWDADANVLGADVLIAFDAPHIVERVAELGKPFIFCALGTHAFVAQERIEAIMGDRPKFCSDLEFGVFGWRYIGKPVDMHSLAVYAMREKHEAFTVAHAPTDRLKKGTRAIERACSRAGVELDIIENVSHDDCLIRKAACHVVIDQVIDNRNTQPQRVQGYAVNALEAWAMGIPVIGQASPTVANIHANHFGSVLPYLSVKDERALREAIVLMRDVPDARRQMANRGLNWLLLDHEPKRVADLWHGALEQALVA